MVKVTPTAKKKKYKKQSMNQDHDLRMLSRGQIWLFSRQQCSDKRITETSIHWSGLTQLRQIPWKYNFKLVCSENSFNGRCECVCEVIEPSRAQLAAEADGCVVRPSARRDTWPHKEAPSCAWPRLQPRPLGPADGASAAAGTLTDIIVAHIWLFTSTTYTTWPGGF